MDYLLSKRELNYNSVDQKYEFACCCSTFNEDRKAIATLSKVRVRVRAVCGGHMTNAQYVRGIIVSMGA